MFTFIKRTSRPRSHALGLPVILRLYLLVVVPAVFWLAVVGWLGSYRLEQLYGSANFIMSLPAALCLLLAAVALGVAVLLRIRPQLFALMAALLVLFAEFGEHVMLWWPGERIIGLHLSTFLVLAALPAVLWLERANNTGKNFSFGLVAVALAFFGVLLSVTGTFLLVERDLAHVQNDVRVRADLVVETLERSLQQPVNALQRMVDRWNVLDHALDPAYIQEELRSYQRDFTEIDGIGMIDASGQPLPAFDFASPGLGMLDHVRNRPAWHEFMQVLGERQRVLLSVPGIDPAKPAVAFVAAALQDANGDYIIAALDLAVLVQQSFINSQPPCCFQVSVGGNVFYRSATVGESVLLSARQDGQVDDIYGFSVNFWQPKTPEGMGWAYYPLLFLFSGMLFTALLVLSQGMARLAELRAYELYRLSTRDLLTGLPNRRMLRDTLNDWFATAHAGPGLSLVFIELCGLRLINDSLGLEIGDRLVQAAARRLQNVVPDTALLARLDGAEFVVCLRLCSDDELAALAQRIIEVISAAFDLQERQLVVSAVIGTASIAGNASGDSMAIVRQADLAMLQAKHRAIGEPWAHYTEAMGEEAALRITLAQELKTAIAAGELHMVYQPIVDIQSGKIVAMEALLRWQHKEHGLIAPAVFVPMAEESGQIVELTAWTLQTACADARHMGLMGLSRVVPFVLNISPMCFVQDDFFARLSAMLHNTGVPANYLEVEITEGVMLRNREQTIAKLQQLAELGVKASLDDFGTGYSSLSLLKDLPVRKIKLDRAFAVEVTSSVSDASIVRGIIDIAHSLDKLVVVEGVETVEQARILAQLGCDQIQGYFFSRPVTPDAMAQLLHQPPDYLALL